MVKSILGEGKPNLSVRGSERITFGGRSQWLPNLPSYEFQRKQSKFPQLEMKQDLTIQLKGSIGDKLSVDIDQSSAATTSFANRIKIHYRGYEDEIIRKLDLGNTSLQLRGTEYVSYGGSHTGLFGINTETQFGPVTMSFIISKQEGETAQKSTSIRSEKQNRIISDYDYIRDRFFFLDDPTRPAYADIGLPFYVVHIREGSVRLWLDNGNGATQEEFATSPGIAVQDLKTPAVVGDDAVVSDTLYFEQLEHEKDFWVWTDTRYEGGQAEAHSYVVLNRYVNDRSTLGVTYFDVERNQNVGGFDESGILHVKMIRPADEMLDDDISSGEWGPTNRLMMRNIYSLHTGGADWSGQGLPEASIMEDGFEMKVRYLGTIDNAEDPDEIEHIKLIRFMGVDFYQETDIGLQEGEDGKLDVRAWVDTDKGLIYFPDLQPFAPLDSIDADRTYRLRGRPVTSEWDTLPEPYWNRGIYDRRSCVRERVSPGSDPNWRSMFYLEVDYQTPVTELRIDAWDLIEGSEVVTASGRRLERNRDYRINYQTGVITILDQASIDANDEINVTYNRAGGFAAFSKTLMGAAAIYNPEDSKLSLSSAWLYEQRGSPDRRPRLGSEPTRMTVGEFAGTYATESMGLTSLLDFLPMLDVRHPSRVDLEGGIGISFPNPNTRNDLYLDDFEGVAEDIHVRINRLAWKPTSIPVGATGFDAESRARRRGELWWYTPYRAVQNGDLNPTLDYQEANDYRQVLELQVWPYPSPDTLLTDVWDETESWVGVVQGLSGSNLDLSRARFLDIWINDFDRSGASARTRCGSGGRSTA
jgi:hypothetical protein